MAVNNCFPLQIVCVGIKENKYVMVDSLLKKFLSFTNNEIPIIDKVKGEIFFEELSKEKQNSILETKINSVWIKLQ